MLEQEYKFANYDGDEDFTENGGEIPPEDDECSDA